MSSRSPSRPGRFAGLAGALVLGAFLAHTGWAQAPAPPPAVQAVAYSVAAGSAATALGVHPADILGAGRNVLIACEELGLLCAAQDDLASLSFGDDFSAADLPLLLFSVTAQAQGLPGTAVAAEAGCSPAQPQADAFATTLNRDNQQDLDGDGTACAGGAGYGLGLAEGASADDLDALAPDPCRTVDPNCDGRLDAPVLFTLAPGSPSLALVGATPADILLTLDGMPPVVWASAAALGLETGDAIDALCIQEDGDAVYGAGDVVVFSLASGSPSLSRVPAGPGDLLQPTPVRLAVPAATLGLAPDDDVDAALCAGVLAVSPPTKLFAPEIRKP